MMKQTPTTRPAFLAALVALVFSIVACQAPDRPLDEMLTRYDWKDTIIQFRVDSHQLVLTMPTDPQISTVLVDGGLVDTSKRVSSKSILENPTTGPGEVYFQMDVSTFENREVRVPLRDPIAQGVTTYQPYVWVNPVGYHFFKVQDGRWHICFPRFRYNDVGNNTLILDTGMRSLHDFWVMDTATFNNCLINNCSKGLLYAVGDPVDTPSRILD